ncbi:MAG: hypothetical protein K2J48_07010 [Muribaculaceae bacterium]|nr:hypothetical protein [Muribaculaceae bacterium]MDE6792813.1 hypothetical protein [Muribaculaceae bacterium]
MNTKEFIKSLRSVVKEYIADEEAYSDDVQLRINTTNWQIDIADPEDDLPNCDYYPIMDLVSMSTTAPGQWEPDEDAIAEVAAEYVFTD